MNFRPILPLAIACLFLLPVNAQRPLLHRTINTDAYSSQLPVPLSVDNNLLNELLANKPDTLLLPLPIHEQPDTLMLYRTRFEAPGFRVVTSSGKTPFALPDHVAYRGHLRNGESLATIVLTPGTVRGLVLTRYTEYSIGPAYDQSGSPYGHWLRTGPATDRRTPLPCSVTGGDASGLNTTLREAQPVNIVPKCVRMDFEVDDELTHAWGGAGPASEKLLFLFNATAAIYAREGITLRLSYVKLWDAPAPYTHTGSSEATLASFYEQGEQLHGDIVHLLHMRHEGGRATIDGIRAVEEQEVDFSPSPYYSYSVQTIAHELGHNLGSPHTHNCSWPGGAIDNCAPTEGGCAPGPAPTAGGTIMSYCWQTIYGLNMMNGFGPLPGNLIRQRVAASLTFSSCDDRPSCTDSTLQHLRLQADGRQWRLTWTAVNRPVRVEIRDRNTDLFTTVAQLPAYTNGYQLPYASLCTVAYRELRLTPLCDAGTGVPLSIPLYPTGIVALSPQIEQVGNRFYLKQRLAGARYQWYKDGQPTGDTAINYTADAFGEYKIQETLGSCSAFSNALTVAAEADIKAYPNPSWGPFTIQSGGNGERLRQLRLFDARGRLLQQVTLSNTSLATLDLTRLASGIYLLQAVTDQRTTWLRLVRY